MPRTLPALISRPLPPTAPPPADPAEQVLQQELTAGLPARIDLDAARALVLAVPLGVARAVLAADPSTVVFSTADPGDSTAFRDDGAAWPRLTLVVAGAIGTTVPVVAGVPVRLAGSPGTAAVEVIVDELVLTAGTLRSPGRFASRLSLRWTDLTLGRDDGPPHPLGDPGVPVLLSQLSEEM
ncbi:hypothetical protein M8542_19710 [Amycolatopsis sp. OK19-0408]|uniref:Uncharacterized protein n=1 Tax=Amycolatopsis iheyensis TaxID=2945988 RepID=A0A9X2ND05_9PSEU|nr:hypothetical protein [Amycolatopsis iheyensis]MCR6485058.1 hypothetical protein [Amycolatopsis iheyensis]